MGALVATLNNGQLNTAVNQSEDLLKRLGITASRTGQDIDKIGAVTGLRRAGAGVADTQKKLTGLGAVAGRATGAIRTGFAGAVGGIRSFGSSINGATTSFLNLRGAAVSLTAAFSFGSVLSELRGFEATMAQVQGVTRATGEEFGQLQELARDLGRNTQFSAQEAAEGVLFLARAGQDTNTILQTLPPTLKFAQAGAIALGDAANFATNIMGAFSLGADQTEGSLNALVTVANNANTDITSLASALSFAGSSANSAGVSLETTAAAIGVLGDVGIPASRAGTALNKVLIDLSNTDPPDKFVGTLERLGLTI
ncbi:MAG: phage tail tape measure protein, partial [Aestuariivirgaceae bacterium]